MDALFGLISLTEAPIGAEWVRACDDFAAASSRRTAWSDEGARLVAAARASRPVGPATQHVAPSPSGRFQIALAGALHYRADLLRQIDTAPSVSVERGDGFLAALAWEKWERDAPVHLEGEFCLTVVDRRDRTVTLVQSRIEYAPLYYVEIGGMLGFSTSIDALTRLPGVGRALDPQGFVRSVSRFQIQERDLRRTCVAGIERVPSGSAKLRGRQADASWEYWTVDPNRVTDYRSEDEVHLEIRSRLGAAVAERLAGESVVGCLLSGGLDSSSLACLAARDSHAGRRLFAISAVLPSGGRAHHDADEPDERPQIETVQRHLGLDVVMVTPGPDASPWRVPDIAFETREYPTLAPRHYLNNALLKAAAAEGAGVVMDGAGGELGPSFHGRARVRDYLWRTRHGGAAWTARAAGRFIMKRFGGPSRTGPTFAQPALRPWLSAALREDAIRDCGVAEEMVTRPERADDPRRRATIGYPRTWRKSARANVAGRPWALDVTLPFHDPRLWQYCAGLPADLTTRRGYNRYLIRAAMAGILPPAIQWRTTKGAFSADYYPRMQAGARWARKLCDSIEPGEAAAYWVDLAWLRQTLTALSLDDYCHDNIELVFLLQGTVIAIQYLRWFDRKERTAR